MAQGVREFAVLAEDASFIPALRSGGSQKPLQF